MNFFLSTLKDMSLYRPYILLVYKRVNMVNGHAAKHYGYWIQAPLKITNTGH